MNFIDQMNKYILYISIIINAILIMAVTGILPFFLYLSIIINLIFIWYTAKCLIKINDVEEDMINLLEQNETFLYALEEIHSLEMYYGDENLQRLIDKSRELVNEYVDIQEKYFEVEVTPEQYDNEDDEEEDQAEERQPVFHQST